MNSERDRSTWMPPLALFVLGGVAIVLVIRALAADVHAKGFVSINTLQSRVLPLDESSSLAGWIDPRWERSLSRFLAEFEDVSALDEDAIEGLVAEIGSLVFVAEVGTASVVWPDGLAVEIRFEKPVACLGVDGKFLTTSAAGLVLPGSWTSTPEIDGASLPILSAQAYSRGELRPGVICQTRALVDALCVANSLDAELGLEDRRDLGPVVIDASRAPEASLKVPGIVLDLEFGRRILFGRAPDGLAPGELPAALKWESVARGVNALRGGLDWAILDVRWDEPRYVTREGEEGSL